MKSKLVITAIVFTVVTSSAFANGSLSPAASQVDKIVQGHGNPGEIATASSDPNVTFEVLGNGKVQRTNKQFGTVTILDPKQEWRRNRDRR
ncbi:hypothetical protein [Rhizobium sp. LC145]|uniref:hypothetical protein n=1 Tax=Rhizobium sp. LC145 TaxID=1120688 RepID=UPI00062A1574|nr:hypothetical protein [Rhizobium sp. LC145]KKX29443.1 hypothetical protein YH62_16900 [Rhizobium sp. LC145]MDX3927985.1 hypothetical protein [Shinella sp.]TKT66179.1 hypothetical protein FDR95_06785 [Rhizobiaceae bacterium LC148]